MGIWKVIRRCFDFKNREKELDEIISHYEEICKIKDDELALYKKISSSAIERIQVLDSKVVECEDDYCILHFEKTEKEKELDILKYELEQSKDVALAYQIQAKSLANKLNEIIESKEILIKELEKLEDRVGDLEVLCDLKDQTIKKLEKIAVSEGEGII